jgi:hypothetical protein
MRSHSLRILMLGLFSLWFGVIVPGHERGAISVPGYKSPGAGKQACAPRPAHCNSCPAPADDPAGPASPESDPASHCAICHLTGVLDAPTAIVFAIPQAELLACLPPQAYHSIAGVLVLSIDRGRGPPSFFI